MVLLLAKIKKKIISMKLDACEMEMMAINVVFPGNL
jgi:hypothetical protein